MSKMQELVTQLQEFEAKMQKEGKKAISGAFKEFFKSHPEATAIVWAQYTPYFNDGDPCSFSMHGMELKADPKQLQSDVRSEYLQYADIDEDHTSEDIKTKLEIAKEAGNASVIKKYEEELKVSEKSFYEEQIESLNKYSYEEVCVASAIRSLDIDYRYKSENARKLTNEESSLLADFNELASGCHSLEDFLCTMLGDHVMVTVTPNGIETSEYSHD